MQLDQCLELLLVLVDPLIKGLRFGQQVVEVLFFLQIHSAERRLSVSQCPDDGLEMPQIERGGRDLGAEAERLAEEDVSALQSLQPARLLVESVSDGQIALACQRQKGARNSGSAVYWLGGWPRPGCQ